MITFGYKNKLSGFIRALVAITIGLVMVVSRTNALELVVRIIAAFLVATGVVTFVLALRSANKGGENHLMIVNTLVNVLLGILLFCFSDKVIGVLVVLIGVLLLLVGLFQIAALISAISVTRIGVMSFVMPVLVLVAGALLVVRPSFIGEAIGVVAGVSLIIYGASEILSTWKMTNVIDEYEKDVDDQNVDEQ